MEIYKYLFLLNKIVLSHASRAAHRAGVERTDECIRLARACQNQPSSAAQRIVMNQTVRLVIPVAPSPTQAADAHAHQRRISEKGIRLGVLDNSKGNADHLLAMIVEAVRKAVPIASVVFTRKPFVSMAAPTAVLDQLALEADVVISAMAD
jgi:hypothetical protein